MLVFGFLLAFLSLLNICVLCGCSMAPRLLNVLAANKTVLIYSGKLDYICNYVGGK